MKYVILLLLWVESLMSLQPMTYRDIVEIARPTLLQFAANGHNLAFVTRKADIEANCNRDSLFVGTIDQCDFRKIAECDRVIQVIWSENSQCLYVLSKEEGLYRISRYTNQEHVKICEYKEPMHLFTLSPTEQYLYYTVVKMTPDEVVKKLKEEGYVYDWELDNAGVLITQTFQRHDHEEIYSYNLSTHESAVITSLPNGSFRYDDLPLISRMQVSENGKLLLLSVSRYGDPSIGETCFSTDPAVWNLSEGTWALPPSPGPRARDFPTWVSGNAFIYYAVSSEPSLEGLRLFDLSTMQERKFSCLTDTSCHNFYWDKKNGRIYGMNYKTLYRIDLDRDIAESEKLPEANVQFSHFDQEGKHFVCVRESSNVPPEIFYYDMETHESRCLTNLNPQLTNIAHGYVEAIDERTSNGLPIQGCLVHPVHEIPGVRYPIIIATYGFCGMYVAEGEPGHSNFPAQPLAAEGYFVFLLNRPPDSSQELVGDYQKAQELLGWNLLPVFEEAIDLVEKKGGDPKKVGVYGFSHGSFIVNFLITHSQKFHAACLLEGGDYGPAEFWYGGPGLQSIFLNTFEGPPWGPTLQNYIDFSPFFQVEKVTTPLLLEYAGANAIGGLEMYAPLRYLGVPAELVSYANEEHVFTQPKARIAAMGRKADWFNFWLLGKKDPSPTKCEQYKRWELMKDAFIR